jgi:thiazole/oxazole-forming peptide maturase SagC family component
MDNRDSALKLKALPAQLIKTPNGMVIKRGCSEVKINGENAVEIIQLILSATLNDGATKTEICQLVAAPDRATIAMLVDQLTARRILVPYTEPTSNREKTESSLDIFYWNFGLNTAQVTAKLNSAKITIIGINTISRRLVNALIETGIENFEVVDYPLLRNLDLFDEDDLLLSDQWPLTAKPALDFTQWAESLEQRELGCLVATTDLGGQQLMREWNEFCFRRNCHFFPIVLQDLIGYLGPMVIPGETPCYECLYTRQNAHMVDAQTRRLAEYVAFEGQFTIGFHPTMANMLADIAAMELTKFYAGSPLPWRVGTLLEVNLLNTRIEPRRILKIPRCAVCSSVANRPSTNPIKEMAMAMEGE